MKSLSRRSARHTVFSILLMLVALGPPILITGCSGGKVLVPVKGTVKSKGQPLIGAMVMFHPEDPIGLTASGVVGDDGMFTLASGVDQGITPGNYTVTITWPDPSVKPTPQQMMQGMIEPGPDLLKGKYASRQSSSLKTEVTTSLTEPVTFEVDGP